MTRSRLDLSPGAAGGRDGAAEEARERIIDSLDARLAELTRAGSQAIREQIPVYMGNHSETFRRDVERHVSAHYTNVVRSFRRQRGVSPADLLFIREHAARRLGQVSVADFIHAFHVGEDVLWQAVAAMAVDEPSQRAVLDLVERVAQYFHVATTHAADIYLEIEQLHSATNESMRRDLLEDLLAGRVPAPGPHLDAARAAGIAADRSYVVAAGAPTGPAPEPSALRGAASEIARCTRLALAPLAVVRQGEIVVVAPMSQGELDPFIERLAESVSRLAEEGLLLAMGVSTVHDGLGGIASAYVEANTSYARMLPAGGLLALPRISAFDYMTMSGDETARRLVSPAVREFVDVDLAAGGTLVHTLLAYVRADMNVTTAAAALGIHVNTAHYRINKIATRTGCDLRSVACIIELLVATGIRTGPQRLPLFPAHNTSSPGVGHSDR
ncbi:MAG TPA: helix-turn-helix domain-containing protein [Solirubrobacteraceae bacterium]|jgi:hypothetical protein|nr:helix-turn-helix domain-containing protein [Solirubrobacteraceae bacterium]